MILTDNNVFLNVEFEFIPNLLYAVYLSDRISRCEASSYAKNGNSVFNVRTHFSL